MQLSLQLDFSLLPPKILSYLENHVELKEINERVI